MTPPLDTICAIATPSGGAIGIIRVSGPHAITLTDSIFSHDLSEAKGNTIVHGYITRDNGETIDEVMVSVFRAPHSYTGEDATEISCHGSPYIMRRIVETLIDKGCRQALPGEYTQRAFLNGKMDLSQAEAVADLIAAGNAATHKMAMSQLRGGLSSQLGTLRDKLLQMTSLVELELDFSDQDVAFADRSQLLDIALQIKSAIHTLTASFATGNALKQGIAVAIAGKTNVGKSTLLNNIAGEERAIVSDIHGTTRDTIEEWRQIRGVTFRFVDTAGLRPTDDAIEQMGIRRSLDAISGAAIVVWLVDQEPTPQECRQMKSLCGGLADNATLTATQDADNTGDTIGTPHTEKGKPLLLVENKTDLSGSHASEWGNEARALYTMSISAKYGYNTDTLLDIIYRAANIPEISENDVIVTSARHYEALRRAQESVAEVVNGINSHLSADLLSEHLRECIRHLSSIVGGNITPEETLHSIFSRFCIGK